MDTKALGKRGEDAAAAFLERHGYEILDRNYRIRQGEIDIVAKEKDRIVFVEVKTRRGTTFGRPSLAVDRRKQKKIIACAKYYMCDHHLIGTPCRFDVIEIYVERNKATIRHLAGAFECPPG